MSLRDVVTAEKPRSLVNYLEGGGRSTSLRTRGCARVCVQPVLGSCLGRGRGA